MARWTSSRRDGTGYVGPFSGGLGFRMPMRGPEKGRKYITLDGRVSLAGVKGAPFKGTLTTKNGIGGGTFRSGVFEGPLRLAQGRADAGHGCRPPRGLAPGGHPVRSRHARQDAGPDRHDLHRRRLVRRLRGRPLHRRPELRPRTSASPAMSPRSRPPRPTCMGLGALPMFDRAQTLEARFGCRRPPARSTMRLGALTGEPEWIEGGGMRPLAYHLGMTLDKADFAGLGLPLRPAKPLRFDAQGVAAGGGFSGQAALAGAELNYDVPRPRTASGRSTFSGQAERGFASLHRDRCRRLSGRRLDFSGHLVRTQGGAISGPSGAATSTRRRCAFPTPAGRNWPAPRPRAASST